jgi:hypothetical protein
MIELATQINIPKEHVEQGLTVVFIRTIGSGLITGSSGYSLEVNFIAPYEDW